MGTVRVGIIGCGGISGAHFRTYTAIPDVEIVACADVIEERARQRAREFNVPHIFTDYRKLLRMDEIDAVSICTPHTLHAPIAIAALNAGKHVLCEKPMATTAKDAARMVRAARRNGKILQIGIHTRFSAIVQQAKRLIDDGLLGRIYYGEGAIGGRRRIPGPTFTEMATAHGGVVLDIGVYVIDTLLHLLGQPIPLSVTAITSSAIGEQPEAVVEGGWWWNPANFEVEDFGAAFVRFANGVAVIFKMAWAMHADSLGQSFLLGDKGGLKLHPLELYRDESGTMVTITFPNLPRGDTWIAQMSAFIDAIRENKPSPVPPEEVMMTNVIMDAIYESAAHGR
ncbi:MAG TPA: Gfo/Idh/MocA family oxidoreductase, partial [Armatimonadetes bacterium]|nr:Gfo/Idh/MocA family oxidoreductase [Armatimonadota bacterium]